MNLLELIAAGAPEGAAHWEVCVDLPSGDQDSLAEGDVKDGVATARGAIPTLPPAFKVDYFTEDDKGWWQPA